jgi:DNA-binding NarL/FixJ family response regulator
MTPDVGSERKRKVFIVDDHPLVREWLTNLINQQLDLVVCGEAASAEEARQALVDSKAEVIIVDISLKDSSGIELIKDLKKSCPDLTVLVLSMHDEKLYAERALRAGAKGYVMKRASTGQVIEALRRVLLGKFYVSEEVAEAITTRFVAGKNLTSRSPIDQFSDRELTVFKLLGEGRGTRQIAETLHLSVKTVQVYCARMKEKLNLKSGGDLLMEAMRHQQSEEAE